MENTAAAPAPVALPGWVKNVRMAVGIGVVWGTLTLLLSSWVMPDGLSRPAVLIGSHVPALTPIVFLLTLWISTAVAVFIAGRNTPAGALLIASLGVMLWLAPGGTMDDWIRWVDVHPGPPTSEPYWRLLGDWALAVIALGGVLIVGALTGGAGLGKALNAKRLGRESTNGPVTTIMTIIAALLIMYVVMGPAVTHTHRGQVIFAVVAAFGGGAWVIRSIVGKRHPLWSWLAVALVGLIGIVFAGLNPGMMLYGDYSDLDVIPAWWAVRPLPLEMICLGLIATIWSRSWNEDEIGLLI